MDLHDFPSFLGKSGKLTDHLQCYYVQACCGGSTAEVCDPCECSLLRVAELSIIHNYKLLQQVPSISTLDHCSLGVKNAAEVKGRLHIL